MIKNLGAPFAKMRKLHGFNQSDFEGIVSRPTLNRFENGTTEISAYKMFKCLNKMGVTIGEFYAAYCAPKDKPNTYLPVYEFSDLRYKRRKPTKFISYTKGAKEHAYALEVKDAAMNSDMACFPIGSHLIVEPATVASDGDLVIVMKKNQYYFRRYVTGLAIPDNEQFDIIDEPRIVGRVVGATWSM